MIQNRFRVLLAEKELRDGRSWSYAAIHEVTGVSPITLTKFSRQYVTMFSAVTLSRLCAFLECGIGDLLVRVLDED